MELQIIIFLHMHEFQLWPHTTVAIFLLCTLSFLTCRYVRTMLINSKTEASESDFINSYSSTTSKPLNQSYGSREVSNGVVHLMSRSGGGGGGEGSGVVAFFAFDALSFGVADVRMHADAGWGAFQFRAFLWNLGSSVDQERERRTAGGHAVHLVTALVGVHFAITGAFELRCHGSSDQGHRFRAVGSWDADALSVLQMSFLAEAANDAVAGAHRTWDRVGARGRASGAAGVEQLVFTAFRDWWEHHERFWLWDRRAFAGHNAFAGLRSDVSLFAGAALDADAWADGVGVLARAIASFALTEFLVVSAHLWWHRHGFFGWDAAVLRSGADALFVLQVAGLAEASDHAVLRAGGAGVGLGAGGRAGGAAGQEHFVFFALRHFRWIGEEHVTRFLHGESVVSAIAIAFGNAFAFGVLQEPFLTETAHDALHGTHIRFFRISAGRDAGRAANAELGIGAASLVYWEGRDGHSEPEGTNAEQQHESRAKGHRLAGESY